MSPVLLRPSANLRYDVNIGECRGVAYTDSLLHNKTKDEYALCESCYRVCDVLQCLSSVGRELTE